MPTAEPPRYLLPVEWHPQACMWLAWPHYADDWRPKFAAIPHLYVEIVRLLSEVQPVRVLLPRDDAKDATHLMLKRGGAAMKNVHFHVVKTNRTWVRDTLPLFVHDGDGKTVATNWRFNGWAKYKNHRDDNAAIDKLRPHFRKQGVKVVDAMDARDEKRQLVLEGGGIETNGAGTMLVTEEWLLSDEQVRNPGYTRSDYEQLFADWFGCTHTIWLGSGVAGDDTHGHIDDVARFVDETTIVCCRAGESDDANHAAMQDNLERLASATTADGRKITVATLPLPRPVVYNGIRLPASYANFVIANELVLVPTFHDEADAEALATLRDLFPKRRVVGVFCRDLVLGLGTLHCSSMQQPTPLG